MQYICFPIPCMRISVCLYLCLCGAASATCTCCICLYTCCCRTLYAIPVSAPVSDVHHTVFVYVSVATMHVALINANTDLMKARGGCAGEGAPLPLTPLYQLTPVSHLLHHLLLEEEEVHALHLAFLRLLAGVPDANALGYCCFKGRGRFCR